MNSLYTNLKSIFIDGETFDYVTLDRSVSTYDKLVQALDKPFKLILFYGKPGTGKTFILQKIYNDFAIKKHIVFLPRPFFEEIAFLKILFQDAFGETPPPFSNYNEFLTLISNHATIEKPITVLIDEAQLYPVSLIEKIRLLADTRMFRFLFTVHKTEKEDILAKDYFQTRIWETIELENASRTEIKTYIEKKFLFHNKAQHLDLLRNQHYKFIAKFTYGNLRTINKFLYKLFEILEYYDIHKPSSLTKKSTLDIKYFEMTAISLGMIHA